MLNRPANKRPADEEQVYDCALNLLAIRDYSGAGMLDRLLLQGAARHQAEAVVERLRANGLIDERRYARQVYQGWLAKKYYGRLHLQAELQKKQVDAKIRQEILSVFTDEQEAERAAAAAALFRSAWGSRLQAREQRDKICGAAVRFMAARGFAPKYIRILTDALHFTDDI